MKDGLAALKSRRAKLLVLSALPLSALLYVLDRADPMRTRRPLK